jgi:DEAD/DEAH box helicase domain-containing protein
MDAVPGGTGYLKSLYQEKDAHQRDGEGIMDVLRRARDTLETCTCRRFKDTAEDTDGCYRCIRNYHQQYAAEVISRERGIALLTQLITSGERREPKQELAGIKVSALYGSMLEKRFVETLQEWVQQRKGTWEKTLIKGSRGFRFTLPDSGRIWELELQPKLGLAQGVMLASRPDFLLRSDDQDVRPVAIFTDGFEFHCHPVNRLADDFCKRRAVLNSEAYHLWSIAWHDLTGGPDSAPQVCDPRLAQLLAQAAIVSRGNGEMLADPAGALGGGMEQLKAFLLCPSAQAWSATAQMTAFLPLRMMLGNRHLTPEWLASGLGSWRTGSAMPTLQLTQDATWLANPRAAAPGDDLVTCAAAVDVEANRRGAVWVLARLSDTDAERQSSLYVDRWRRFLACMNLYQFAGEFRFWVGSEVAAGTAPDLPEFESVPQPVPAWDPAWDEVMEFVCPLLRPAARHLANRGTRLPLIEYYNEAISDDAFAELAWPDLIPPVAVLAGEQRSFASWWEAGGWRVITTDELQARGPDWLVEALQDAPTGM